MAKRSRRTKEAKPVLEGGDKIIVTRQYREQPGPIDTIWAIIFRDGKTLNDFVANVSTITEEVAPKDVLQPLIRITAPVPMYSVEPKQLEVMQGICEILKGLGHTVRIEKFYIMPAEPPKITLGSLIGHLQRFWDTDPAARVDDSVMRLYSRAITAMRELNDRARGEDKRGKHE